MLTDLNQIRMWASKGSSHYLIPNNCLEQTTGAWKEHKASAPTQEPEV